MTKAILAPFAALAAGICLTGCSGSSKVPAEPANPAWADLFSRLDLKQLPPAAARTDLTYAKDIRPILEGSCFGCHGEQRQRGGLRLDTLEALLKGGENGGILSRGNSDHSFLVVATAQLDDESAMPPKRRGGGPGGSGGRGEMGGMRGMRGMGAGGPGGPGGPMRGGFGGPGPAGGMPPEGPGAAGADGPPMPEGQPGGANPGSGSVPAPPMPEGGMAGGQPPGGPGGFPPGGRGGFTPPQPLTAEQVGLLRAWIDQGAK
ncbi:MAG: hypothetical protein KDM81_01130 [Verrucomicrobiae bacterium]|nr:hypothetical protein [Verrucomicrobiae bacterium]